MNGKLSVNIGNLILWENVNIKKDDGIMKNIFKLFFRNSHAESLSKETVYLEFWRINYIVKGAVNYHNYMAMFFKCIKIPLSRISMNFLDLILR